MFSIKHVSVYILSLVFFLFCSKQDESTFAQSKLTGTWKLNSSHDNDRHREVQLKFVDDSILKMTELTRMMEYRYHLETKQINGLLVDFIVIDDSSYRLMFGVYKNLYGPETDMLRIIPISRTKFENLEVANFARKPSDRNIRYNQSLVINDSLFENTFKGVWKLAYQDSIKKKHQMRFNFISLDSLEVYSFRFGFPDTIRTGIQFEILRSKELSLRALVLTGEKYYLQAATMQYNITSHGPDSYKLIPIRKTFINFSDDFKIIKEKQ